MKSVKGFFIIIIFLANSTAQEIIFNQDSTSAVISNNRIYFPLDNKGILAGPIRIENNITSATYDNIDVIYTSGFFISGYSDTRLWASGVAHDISKADFLSGKVGSSPQDPLNKVYVVKETDTPFGESWQSWKHAVEQGAYFYDGDGDGIYNPVDLNGNGQWDANEDKPHIIYDASLYTVYNDGVPADQRYWSEGDPLGIEIRQTVSVSNRNTFLDDVIFVRYSIEYKGSNIPGEPDSLTDVIYSMWLDADIGELSDDLAGCDTNLQSGFMYNDSTDFEWGINPPAVFNTIVQGPLKKSGNPNDVGYNKLGPNLGEKIFQGYRNEVMTASRNMITDSDLGAPSNISMARYCMLGLTRSGRIPDPCDWPYGEVKGDVDCAEVNPLFWHSGDPVTNNGWISTTPSDQRILTSTGKFTLRKNESMDIIVAYTVGRGTDHLNSITVARETVQYIHEEYERNFSTIVGVEDDKKEELPSSFTLYQNYPNPFNPTTRIKYQVASIENVSLKAYDILGREITTLLNEAKHPGNYELEFDASYLPSGVYIYRLNAGMFSESKKMILLR